MTDYSLYETADADPEAFSLIETFRAVGYSLEAALADIIDNSIFAGAGNVWVDFDWKGPDTWFSVRDDGRGMDNAELIRAMRPGSKNPREKRDAADLGRFGMGLKTASFSQCRQLSVISKKEGNEIVYWTWDLDFVEKSGKWQLLKYLPDHSFTDKLNTPSGTLVVWTKIDRLTGTLPAGDESAFEKFLSVMHDVKRNIGMVFHRFMEERNLKIFFNGQAVLPWNPFLPYEKATQSFADESLEDGVIVKGFVLPHKAKLTHQQFTQAEGPGGWTKQQGFYVYRNGRLLLGGNWLGLFRKQELYKLARIRVDLPNHLDTEWQIDIKKSTARLPLAARDQLFKYTWDVLKQAAAVYSHRGKVIQQKLNQIYQPIWLEKITGGKRSWVINREHPFIKNILQEKGNQTGEVFRLLEETLPIPLIAFKEMENPDSFKRPFEDVPSKELAELIGFVYQSLRNKHTEQQAKSLLHLMEDFNGYPELIESL